MKLELEKQIAEGNFNTRIPMISDRRFKPDTASIFSPAVNSIHEADAMELNELEVEASEIQSKLEEFCAYSQNKNDEYIKNTDLSEPASGDFPLGEEQIEAEIALSDLHQVIDLINQVDLEVLSRETAESRVRDIHMLMDHIRKVQSSLPKMH